MARRQGSPGEQRGSRRPPNVWLTQRRFRIAWTLTHTWPNLNRNRPSPARHPRGSLAYRGVRGLIRLLLWLFYRRIDVVGRERIPETGAVIVAANHHNALVDAMLIMATIPRPITALAKAPLFRHPLIGP